MVARAFVDTNVLLRANVVDRLLNKLTPLFRIADETSAVRLRLLELLHDHPTMGKQVHDTNIVATMLVYEIDMLLTLNIDDLKRFRNKIKLISPLSNT